MRFVALSFFFLFANFCPFWCKHVKVTANDKVERFFGTRCRIVIDILRYHVQPFDIMRMKDAEYIGLAYYCACVRLLPLTME